MNKKKVLMGENVKMYGTVQIGSNVIIESGVVIGHPAPDEIGNIYDLFSQFQSLDEHYQQHTHNPTIIGDYSIIRSGSVIYSGCKIGHHFDCGHNVVIRENVSIGDKVYIKPFSYIMTCVEIGNCCRIAGTIADFSVIGNNVSSFGMLTHRRLRRHSELNQKLAKTGEDTQGPIIADNCVIGRDAVIVGKVHIGLNSTIGANTFVNFDVSPNSKVVGIKGKYVTSQTEE